MVTHRDAIVPAIPENFGILRQSTADFSVRPGMGVSIEIWRGRIGSFTQPLKNRGKTQKLTLNKTYVCLSVRIALFLLLAMIDGVEPNPGPGTRRGSTNNTNNTRGAITRSGGRGADSLSRYQDREHVDNDIFANSQTSSQSSIPNTQSTINAWFPSVTQNSNNVTESACSDPVGTARNIPTTDNTLMPILLDIQVHVRNLDKKFDTLEQSINDLKLENKQLREQNVNLTGKVDELTTSVNELELSTNSLNAKHEQLESQSRRQNLIFYDMKESPKETWEQSEQSVRDYIRDELHMDDSDIKIERAHRLYSKDKPRPLIVKFSFYKDKECVLKNIVNSPKKLACSVTVTITMMQVQMSMPLPVLQMLKSARTSLKE